MVSVGCQKERNADSIRDRGTEICNLRYSDSLCVGRFGDRIPAEARFSAPVQTDRETHSALCTMGTVSLFRGVKRSGRGLNHPLTSSAKVKERVELYLYSRSGTSWAFLGRTLRLLFAQRQKQLRCLCNVTGTVSAGSEAGRVCRWSVSSIWWWVEEMWKYTCWVQSVPVTMRSKA
jgi:hypothetical protein